MIEVRPTETPFLRLDPYSGWRASSAVDRIIEDPVSEKLRLGKPGDFPISPVESFATFGGMTLPRGVTISDSGRLLLADPLNNRILYYDSLLATNSEKRTDFAETFPLIPLWQTSTESIAEDPHALLNAEKEKPSPYQLNEPKAVVFSPNKEVFIADSGNSRVLVFTWPELRLRQEFSFKDGEPVALAFDSKKRLYVLDSARGEVIRFNRLLQRDLSFIQSQTLNSPQNIAIDSQDNILILDKHPDRILQLDQKGKLTELSLKSSALFQRKFIVPPLALVENQLEYAQQNKTRCDTLKLVGINIDSVGNLAGTSLPLIARPRSIQLPTSGTYVSEQFDSEISSSQWHRIVLSATVPTTGRILVQTLTSDRSYSETELENAQWSDAMVISDDEAHQIPEVLIQSSAGRYLRLKLEFLGDGFLTPEIEAILIYGHRKSALNYLPAPFQQDLESRHFLDRFLSYFDTLQEEVRFLIKDFTRYLDPHGVPPGPFLDWLGSWFDWKFLAEWPTELRREMILNAISFYKSRGTLKGLKQMLQWHTGLKDNQPQIIEHYRVRDYQTLQNFEGAISEVDVATPQYLYIGEKPFSPAESQMAHWFSVVLPVSVVPDHSAFESINALIESQKPAHTKFQICIFNPGIRIGKQSSIGVDTWLGHYPRAPLGELKLGQSSSLIELGNSNLEIGRNSLQ